MESKPKASETTVLRIVRGTVGEHEIWEIQVSSTSIGCLALFVLGLLVLGLLAIVF